MALTHALTTNNYGPAKLIVATSAANGTHTTLASAMADAVSGDTIFLRNSVTENVTLTPGVNITAWNSGTLNNPSITGTLTMTGAGTCNLSNLILVTNSAALIAVTGSADSILNVNNCYLNCSNNTGITFSSSSSNSMVNVSNSKGNIGTTGITLITHTSNGFSNFNNCLFTNTGNSVSPCTCSAGVLTFRYTGLALPISSSSIGSVGFDYSNISTINTIGVTVGGSGNGQTNYSTFTTGTASSLSINTGCQFLSEFSSYFSTNTNVITGAGSFALGPSFFDGRTTNPNINVTTQIARTLGAYQYLGNNTGNAPVSGMIGEQIRANVLNSAPVSLVTGTAKTVTSISLTAGVWDVTGIIGFQLAATTIPTLFQTSLSAVNNSSPNVYGDSDVVWNTSAAALQTGLQPTLTVPSYRVTVSSTTTYYLVATCTFTISTASSYGRISATRVA